MTTDEIKREIRRWDQEASFLKLNGCPLLAKGAKRKADELRERLERIEKINAEKQDK